MISVIVPNYNHGLYLKQRIDSILSQTYKDFELIILDDYSTDNSRDIIEQYRDHPNISHISYNARNSGSPFKQWNKGVELACGKFVWIAESDDYADCKFVENCLAKLSADDEIDLVYSDSVEVDENDKVLGRWSRWQEYLNINLWKNDFISNGAELNSIYNYVANIIPNASAVIFKRESYQNSPFLKSIETLKFTGDWLMWFSILQKSHIGYCHQPLNYFRYHENTTRSNFNGRLANLKEQYSAMRTLARLVEQHPDKSIREKKFNELYAFWNPSIRHFITTENLEILRLALQIDPKIIFRLLKTVSRRLYAV